jgi:hypothetical protein
MLVKTSIVLIFCLFCASLSNASSIHNYIEVGLGANKLFSFNSDTNKYLSDYSVAPSFKLSTGSRLNQSRTVWFELGYSYNGEMKYKNTKLNSQSLFTGLKLTTDPANKTSMFIRGGAGKTWSETKITGNTNQSNQSNHYYGAAGLSFRLNHTQSMNIELQHINDARSDEAINGVFLNFNQFI